MEISVMVRVAKVTNDTKKMSESKSVCVLFVWSV